ncbi:putative G-protein coupled receptor [Portunus trituberculatus]|uniref:Putative G-protein coupled receptor n=1 Tax=Portunus trituberculatus TaxID=210409 RepID=A0A5B7H5L4_PORTR|nr:putative G-protein coupled receptor [Portunus trituberculatus]
MALVYHYRSVKVFRLASPTFLCICLIGCIIMYFEVRLRVVEVKRWMEIGKLAGRQEGQPGYVRGSE